MRKNGKEQRGIRGNVVGSTIKRDRVGRRLRSADEKISRLLAEEVRQERRVIAAGTGLSTNRGKVGRFLCVVDIVQGIE